MEINENYRRRRGRIALSPTDKRSHTVSARLNVEELALLDSKRGDMERGEWMRCAALDRFQPIVPEPNQEKWTELARAASNLNQIAKALNTSHGVTDEQFAPVRKILNEFRMALVGISE